MGAVVVSTGYKLFAADVKPEYRGAATPTSSPACRWIDCLRRRAPTTPCCSRATVGPLWRRRWLVHALTIWGFLGLFGATLIDCGLDLLGVKETGTVAGLSLMYGVSVFTLGRWRRWSAAQATSTGSDWMLLALLWITGATGFVSEMARYLGQPPAWGYWFFLLHVAVAMELMLMLPFTKFADAMYRPVALFSDPVGTPPAEAAPRGQVWTAKGAPTWASSTSGGQCRAATIDGVPGHQPCRRYRRVALRRRCGQVTPTANADGGRLGDRSGAAFRSGTHGGGSDAA